MKFLQCLEKRSQKTSDPENAHDAARHRQVVVGLPVAPQLLQLLFCRCKR